MNISYSGDGFVETLGYELIWHMLHLLANGLFEAYGRYV